MTTPATTPVSPQEVRWQGVAQAVGLVGLMALCYWRTLDGGFLWDDHLMLPADASARSWHGLTDLWFSTKPFDYYPVTYTAFWLEWHLWGEDPLGYHLVGLALAVLNVFLLWRLLGALRVPGAWLGALWFGVHPVAVASVAWIAETKNTLSLAYCLGSALVFVQAGGLLAKRLAHRWYALSLGLFVLAVLSKSSVVMLPCVLLLLTWWKTGRIGRVAWWRSLPFFAVSLAAGLGTIWFHHHRAMGPDAAPVLPFLVRGCLAGRTVVFYFGKALWPTHLSMIYPRWELGRFTLFSAFPAVLVAAGLWLAWQGRARWGRGMFTASAYFVLTLLPVSGLLKAALFKESFVFDHLMYVALVGFAAAAAAVLESWRLAAGGGSRLAAAAMVLVTLGLVAGSLVRADDFTSSENLWRATLRVNPDSGTAHNNLGLAYLNANKPAAAEPELRAALTLDPHDSLAGGNLASLFQRQGRWREAAAAYATVLANRPDAQTFNNDGVALLHLGENARARAQFEQAAKLEPGMLSPRFNLYKLAIAQGDFLAAADELTACLRLDPDDVPSLLALAVLDIRAAAPDTIPPAAVALAQRAGRLVGTSNPLPREILDRARHLTSTPNVQPRLPEVALRIEQGIDH